MPNTKHTKNSYQIAESILRAPFSNNFSSIDLYGASVAAPNDASCNHFHLENESGVGDISLYHVFPGIELVYNDMHMAYCNQNQKPAADILEINYCIEGRCECLFGDHQYCYMAVGDLSFCSLQDHAHQSEFPTSHYHGITITVDFSRITEEMRNILTLLSVNLEQIKTLSQMHEFTIIRANPAVRHIFSELYQIPENIRQGYIRVKVLELLLILTGMNPEEDKTEHVHFSEMQIRITKEIHAFLMEHFNEHHTIAELSERFELSPTTLKKCFKGVYGCSVYSYMKQYRLQVAERLLKESTLTVNEIALQIGYLNPNKFTAAFNTAYGMPPTSYRRKQQPVQTDRKKPVQ